MPSIRVPIFDQTGNLIQTVAIIRDVLELDSMMDSTLLIVGETGTGKDHRVEAIHNMGAGPGGKKGLFEQAG